MKILVSTGNGRLHLIQSALYLNKVVNHISVIAGWIPKKPNGYLVKIASVILKHQNLSAGMLKRASAASELKIISCGIPEFLTQFLFYLSQKLPVISKDAAATLGWKIYGWYSTRYITNCDIFHVRSGAGQGGAIKRARANGSKIVVDHSIAHPQFFDRHVNSEYSKYNQPTFIKENSSFWGLVLHDCLDADLLLVNSDFVKKTFIDAGYQSDKIAVVYLGVRSDFCGIKECYDKSGPLKILFTGSFEIRKGAEYILKSIIALNQRGLDYQLVVVGTVTQLLINKYADNLKNIKFIGHVPQDELKAYLSDADVYLFPSLGEGCASSAMEAMAAGLPIIATEESGLPIVHDRNGIVIPAKDDESIISALIQLDSDQKLRETLGKNAATTISKQYTWSKYANSVSNIYSQLLECSNK